MIPDDDFFPEELKKYVVITGDFSSGFVFHGPFDSFDDAADSAAGKVPGSWVSVMWPPIENRKGPEWQQLSRR